MPLMNWGLGAVQVKRMAVELVASACTLPGGMVGTAGEQTGRGQGGRGAVSGDEAGRGLLPASLPARPPPTPRLPLLCGCKMPSSARLVWVLQELADPFGRVLINGSDRYGNARAVRATVLNAGCSVIQLARNFAEGTRVPWRLCLHRAPLLTASSSRQPSHPTG